MSFTQKTFLRICMAIVMIISPYSNGQNNDPLFNEESPSFSEYYPYVDSLSFWQKKAPIKVGIEIVKLRDLDIKKPEFYVGINLNAITPDTIEVTPAGDTVLLFKNPFNFFFPEYPEHDRTFKPVWEYPFYNFIGADSIDTTALRWYSYMETVRPHVWDMRNYPFDEQKLKIVIDGQYDTSVLDLIVDTSLIHVNNNELMFIQDGLQVTGITTTSMFFKEEGSLEKFTDGERQVWLEKLIFEINLDRRGSYLYFKLFFGGFLSFLISFLVYTISPKLFETRITLSLGGIFGAVGNKYFVENSMPNIQVLTKADIINNLVIVFIILNIFIVIGQQTRSIPLGRLEKNSFASKIILISFILTNLIIVYT